MLRASAKIFSSKRILVTGALGQIGSELVEGLWGKYGAENVIMSDIRPADDKFYQKGKFVYVDVLDYGAMAKLVVENKLDTIINLSAIMSVLGEQIPQKALDLNINGTRNTFELARNYGLKVLIPSTMAVFNEKAGKIMTKDDCILDPTTVYGITKVFLEQLGGWYRRKYGVDFRSVRLPGIIGPGQLPGGGTTDYAVHMHFEALRGREYVCPVNADEQLPMMYVPDCVDGLMQILDAPKERLTRCVYNMAGFSFCPEELRASIAKKVPDVKVRYERGLAQDIAHSWPDSMDDSNARRDWDWCPKFDLDKMTADMLEQIPKLHHL